MPARGRLLGVAALALIGACGRDPAPEAPPANNPAQATALAVPVAPSASPSPEPSVEPSPTASPSVTPSPVALTAYAPRDECAKAPGFAAFRTQLAAAVTKRDVDAVVALADPKVNLDFGGGAGTDELRKRLVAENSPLWANLSELLTLGCALDGSVTTQPWIFSRVPDSIDAAKTMLVTGTEVPLRAKPAPTAAQVRALDWALVALAGDAFDSKAAYAEVIAADSSRGFVATRKLRSVLDYRLIADRQGEDWRITALIAGD